MMQPSPVGALSASWSRVRHSPPNASIRFLAPSENFKAAIVMAGISAIRRSSEKIKSQTDASLLTDYS